MAQQAQSIFFIEQLQPEYITKRAQRWTYTLIDRLGLGLIVGVIAWSCFPILGWFPPSIIGLLGLLFGTLSGRELEGKQISSQGIWQFLLRTILGGLLGILILGSAVILSNSDRAFVLLFGLSSALLFGLAGGPSIQPRRIAVVETFRWSWSRAMWAALAGLAVGLAGGLAITLVTVDMHDLRAPQEILGLILFFGVLFGLGAGVGLGLAGDEIEIRVIPNQGIRRSARSAIVGGFLIGLIGVLSILAI
jgi:hypothetical protein